MHSFYTNENFPLKIVERLRSFGYNVLTSFEAGRANQSILDEDVLLYAIETKRILLTLNRKDFMKLHKIFSNHFGIIVCTNDPDLERQSNNIHNAVSKENSLDSKLIKIYQEMK